MIRPVCADKIITVNEFNPGKLEVMKRKQGNQKTKERQEYIDKVTAFDIETSTLTEECQAFMYIWQFQWGTECTVVGRTWDEFNELLYKLQLALKNNQYIVIYVHNLSFEFQFLRGIYKFADDEVFAVASRKILKCTMLKHFEFRCSYFHSNMNLETFANKMGAAHSKKAGALDYSVIRWPYTELTQKEMEYCVNDVRGLVEALTIEMGHDGDNLYTTPLTSTGYVRRDVKNAVRESGENTAKSIVPDMEIYIMLREAFRGGNTHANRWYTGKIIENVKSADRSSSYPDVLCNCKFPITKFFKEPKSEIGRVVELMEKRGKALLFRAAFENMEQQDEYWGCPYISKDKARNISTDAVIDNGRVLSCSYLELTLTDIDFKIILEEYNFTGCEIWDLYSANYGKLPSSIIQQNIEYYKFKTELKGVDGQELLYMKSKNKLNSIYGMMAQNPVKAEILFADGEYIESTMKSMEELLNENNRKCFLAYQWGVWCTAWARRKLEDGIRMAKEGFIYCDTDSVKYIGSVDFTEFNKGCIEACKLSGSYAKDPKGNTHYMGVYEEEKGYEKFATLGAKKYAYIQDGKLCATIAGVSKRDGGPELERGGGLEAFKPGFVFHDAGGTESIYNDEPYGLYTMPNGERMYIGENVVIKDSTYKLGVSAEYARLLNYYEDFKQDFKKVVDNLL